MFVNEEALNQEPKWDIEVKHNDIRSHSYFTEAVEEMLDVRMMNEGYFQDMLNTINDVYRANAHYITDGLFALCKENQRIARETTRSFVGDFSSIIREKSRWFKENEKIIRSRKSTESITAINVCYQYQHLDDIRIPNMTVMKDVARDLSLTRSQLRNSGSAAEKRLNLEVEYQRIYDEVHTEQYYAKARGSMFVFDNNAEKASKISSEDYPVAIFDFFRAPSTGTFGPGEIRDIANRFPMYSKYVTIVRNMMADMDRIYETINGGVRDLERYSKEMMYDEKLLDAFNKYMVILQDQIYHISGIVIMAFSGKLDAICKSYLQDYEVLKQVVDSVKTGGDVK